MYALWMSLNILCVSKPSVSHAVKLLREGGFLIMNDDYTLRLTDSGQEVAEKLYERHQYFTERLTDAGVDTDTAEVEACQMEHTISDDSFKKLRDLKREFTWIEKMIFCILLRSGMHLQPTERKNTYPPQNDSDYTGSG